LLTSKSAAIRPRPVDDPEMKMRDMVLLLSGRPCTATRHSRTDRNSRLREAAVLLAIVFDVRFGSFTTDAFSTRADQCPLLLQ
jgi:hypothetical protein